MGAKHSVSVAGAVVREDGRILAIRRHDSGAWEAPGGVLELDETVEAGLAREIREETGIEAEPVALTGVYKNMKVGVVALFSVVARSAGLRLCPRRPPKCVGSFRPRSRC